MKGYGLACALFISLLCEAQDLTITRYAVEEGLSQNSILALHQDRLGYLWIGTERGLNRYDGYRFMGYKSHDAPRVLIQDIIEDTRGNLLIGHAHGVSMLDPAASTFTTIIQEHDLHVQALLLVGNDLYVGSAGRGLYIINLETLEKRMLPVTGKIPPHLTERDWNRITNSVFSLAQYGSAILIGTRGGGLFEYRDGVITRPACAESFRGFVDLNEIRSMTFDENGRLILGTAKGMGIFWNHFTQGRLVTVSDGLSLDRIAHATYDSFRKCIWIATYGGGLNCFFPDTGKVRIFRSTHDNAKGLSTNALMHVLLDNANNVWVGSWAGGLHKINRNSLHFDTYGTRQGLASSLIIDIIGAGDTLWVVSGVQHLYWALEADLAHSTEGRKVFNEKKIDENVYISQVTIGKKHVWLSLEGSGVGYFRRGSNDLVRYMTTIPNNPNSLDNRLIMCAVEDPSGDQLWVGTWGGGIKKINLQKPYGTSGSVTNYPYDSVETIGANILDMVIDARNFLWVGTSSGLSRSERPLGNDSLPVRFVKYSDVPVNHIHQLSTGTLLIGTPDGLYEVQHDSMAHVRLKDHYINAIESVGEEIWVSTNTGLFRIQENETLQHFDAMDGVQGNEFNRCAAYTSEHGRMYFGGVNGFSAFNPHDFGAPLQKSPVVISSIQFLNKAWAQLSDEQKESITISRKDETTAITVDHDVNIINLGFSAVDFTNPGKTKYMYRLHGFDTDWNVPLDGSNTATYTNLSPGNYVFQVIASNSDGIWNEAGATLHIKVRPPVWRSGWAYALYAILLLAAGFFIRKSIINRMKLKQELALEEKEIEKLRELDEFKSKFFANITHEFKTPLTLIMAPTKQMIASATLNDETLEKLQIVDRSASRLNKLISQLLDISKLDSGTLEVKVTEIELDRFFLHLCTTFTAAAEDKGIQFNYPARLPRVCIRIDEDKLDKIVSNLISNAVKFTPFGGRVELRVYVDEQTSTLSLSVSDTGIGLDEADKQRIFERFYRSPRAVQENIEGTGIGLSLTKELVIMLRGSITVESSPAVGSTFNVSLPIEVCVSHPIAPSSVQEAGERTLSDKTWADTERVILLVEDNTDMQHFMELSLMDEFVLIKARDGEQGLNLAKEHIPDIILTDLMMPKVDGITFCQQVKSENLTRHIPVILITAKADQESKLEALKSGADDYITKPFEMEEVRLKVRNWLEERKRWQEKIRSELYLKPSALELLSDDEMFMLKLKELIESKMGDAQLTVESLSHEVALSRAQLYRKVLAITGISVNEYIRTLRLKRAADMLRQRSGTVSEVAFDVGFNNLSYFAKCFRDLHGTTPSEFIKDPS